MKVMKRGYRTIAIAITGMVAGALASVGIIVPQDVEAGITAIVAFALMLGMRMITTGSVGEFKDSNRLR